MPERCLSPRMYNAAVKPLVGIIMGSTSDWETLKSAADTLERLGVPIEVRVVSAHRTPDLLFEYATTARDRGLEVIIAGAGGAAHLPGMTASKTSLPVLGVPVQSKALSGLDSLLSIVQMPAGSAGRHAGDRRRRRDQRGTARRVDPRERTSRSRAPRSTRYRAAQTETGARRTGSTQARRHMKIGVIGAGQLGRMLALAGFPLGLQFQFPRRERRFTRRADRTDRHRRIRRCRMPRASRGACDLVTYEFENVPVDGARADPGVDALSCRRSRRCASRRTGCYEKELLRQARHRHAAVPRGRQRCAELEPRRPTIGLPAVLKTRRLGYDGRGQRYLRRAADVDAGAGRRSAACR